MAGIIQDSGNRREFESGAVRDIAEGKGRCDLLPLDIIGEYFSLNDINENNGSYEKILCNINNFIRNGNELRIYGAIDSFIALNNWSPSQAFMEVSKHYEEGAKKYAERNWEKGIPAHCYVDSGIRHFLKWIDKWNDEPHDRAFLWNMFGLLWTVKHKPEMNDLPYVNSEGPGEFVEIPEGFPMNN